MAKTDPHRAFVTAWQDFGERYLVTDKELVGPSEAWFKVCKGMRWWDDDRLPPENPLASSPRRKLKRKRRSAPVKVSVRVLSGIGKDLVAWAGVVHDDSMPARHRDREAEFQEKVQRELAEMEEWLAA